MHTPGFSKPRLDRFRETLAGHVERKQLPGLVALISHGEHVHIEVLGAQSFDHPAPMQRDTIFRIASLTKVITAAATMILIEECKLRLDDPVDPWLPELADRRVLKSLDSPLEETVPAQRAITVRDLLTYRMGFGSVMAPPGTYPIQAHIREQRIGGDGPMLPTDYPATDEWLRRLGELPLLAQPGERWLYHVSGDVLGALIARVTGQSFGAFLQERLFAPLGMRDTAFHLPPEKHHRLPAFLQFNPQTQSLQHFEDPARSAWSQLPAFESGGGGLLSTLDDYFTFSRLLLNLGRHAGEQILSRAAIELMTIDHLRPEHRQGAELFFGDFSSWGLGFAIDTARRELYHSPGRYGWTGGHGTTAYNDPANQAIGILFTQRMMDSPEPPKVFTHFWTLAYGAME